jgi:hypothetical protein
MAAARRRSRSFTFARSWDTASDSVAGIMNAQSELDVLLDGMQGAATVAEDDDDEKLSSDQHTLSRRNAAEARRQPVCSSTIASSMRPRWKQTWPRTKYVYVDVGIDHQETTWSDSHSRQIKAPIRAMLKVPYLPWV